MPEHPTPTEADHARERQPGVPPFRYAARLANEIELAWQERWAAAGVHHAPNPVGDLAAGFDAVAGRPKAYILDMFPYPSGRGLHVGHPLGYIATDIFARFKRMTGFTVLHAMGYDAFGLPAEQYAVQTGTHPRITTEQNIASMRAQLRRLGLGHDDRRSVATTDVSFYRWTQWIFLQIYNSWYDERAGRARPIADLVAAFESGEREPVSAANPAGAAWADLDDLTRRRVVDSWRLAYLDEQPVNWCPMLGTVLANEEVTADGRSERGNYPVYRRPLKQWVLRITAYAERLLRDLDLVDWPEPVKLMQRNWIGRSEGARLKFRVERHDEHTIEVFTTRPDTIFGATYMVLAPEHPLVDAITPDAWPVGTPDGWKGQIPAASPRDAVAAYRAAAGAKSDVQRQAETKEKTGVFTGAHAINPVSGERVPIFIADYVLMGYGTGAIMAVPAHDERDFDFAVAFDLPIRDVVYPAPIAAAAWFLAHTPDADAFPLGWELALADFVALATGAGYDEMRYPDLLGIVRARRAQVGDDAVPVALPAIDQPGGVGERRGAVQAVWIETLGDIIALGFERARDVFASGDFWRTRATPYIEPGVAANSPPIDGLRTADAKRRMIEHVESVGAGAGAVIYKLRDWLFSRQRYWGEPFPIVFDEHGLPVALPESMLPVELPDLDNFQPEATDDPEAPPRPPLGRASGWASVTLDLGDGPRKYTRELNTMPQWAGSCWYYLRYLDPTNDRAFCDPAVEQHWMLGDSTSGTGVSPVGETGGTGVSPVRTTPPRHEPAARPDLTTRRRSLPHWEQGGSTYFITFRAAPGVSWSYEERSTILGAWKHWHGDRMSVHVLAIMPDHVHALLTPRLKSEGEWWPLASLMHSVKSFSAHEIAKTRGVAAVYQDEYYDRIIRDDDEFREKWAYIADNARRAGLVDRPEVYEFLWAPEGDADELSHGRDARATGEGEAHGRDARATGEGEAHGRDARATGEGEVHGRDARATALCGGVDLYVGGVEHAVLHLLYARFWHKVLYDLGHVSTVEPFHKLYNQGYILAPAYTDARGIYVEAAEVAERDGAFYHHGEPVRREFGKMGKSLKNSVTPDEICAEFGADTLRLYEMYMGPLDQSKPWNPRDIVGMHRFLQRLWRVMIDEETGAAIVNDAPAGDATRRQLHKTIAGVRSDCESLQFNTAIAKINEFTNHLTRTLSDGACPREVAETLTRLVAPFVPHIADELWRRLGHDCASVVLEEFPAADPALLVDDEVELAVQVLGKVRGRITVPADADESAITAAALADEHVQAALAGKTVRKVIVVQGRLVNIVAG